MWRMYSLLCSPLSRDLNNFPCCCRTHRIKYLFSWLAVHQSQSTEDCIWLWQQTSSFPAQELRISSGQPLKWKYPEYPAYTKVFLKRPEDDWACLEDIAIIAMWFNNIKAKTINTGKQFGLRSMELLSTLERICQWSVHIWKLSGMQLILGKFGK